MNALSYDFCAACNRRVTSLEIHEEQFHPALATHRARTAKKSTSAQKVCVPESSAGLGASTAIGAELGNPQPPRVFAEGGNLRTGTTPPASPPTPGEGQHAASSPLRADEGVESGTSLAVRDAPGLPAIERVKALLAECVRVDEVKEIRDQAVAVAAYYQQRSDALEIQNDAAEIRLRAERRLGELLKATPRNKGGRGTPAAREEVPPPLADIGITHKQSSMWQRIAAIAEESFEDRLAEAKENGLELTASRVLGVAKAKMCPSGTPAAGEQKESPRHTQEQAGEPVRSRHLSPAQRLSDAIDRIEEETQAGDFAIDADDALSAAGRLEVLAATLRAYAKSRAA